MKNILITGGDGYIAKSIYNNLKDHYNITIVNRNNFDLTDREATNHFFQNRYFDCVIHAAIKGGSRLEKDPLEVTHINLSMFYNLLANQSKFSKLINFGSGAELGLPTDPYGLSKNVISTLIKNTSYFYNVRIFAVFDENELETRFIKANIKRYINKQPLEIHQDKQMDFFYMDDLIKVVKFYIDSNHIYDGPLKEINCCYDYHYTLNDIAQIINTLDSYTVPINILNDTLGEPYVGEYNTPLIKEIKEPRIKYTGLKQGIIETYNKIKNEY